MSSETIAPQRAMFGTFLGVFTPSLLTIMGLIMYLRFGWVVGNAGLGTTLLMVVMGSAITLVTALSAAAIATNIDVKAGGEYYLISRSLGLEAGGAIGYPLFLCRTLSVAFYAMGLVEAVLVFWPEGWGTVHPWAPRIAAAAVIVGITGLSGRSAALVLKTQLPVMVLVGVSVVALAVGVLSEPIRTPAWTGEYSTAPEGFWFVFAVFFPAVTGFAAGMSMSGELRNPRRSIPLGTLGAVAAGTVIYLVVPVFLALAGGLSPAELADPEAGLGTWTKVALLGGVLIIPAVWGSILCQSFGCILGAPRVLQAMALDGLAPKVVGRLSRDGQPLNATWVTGGLALVALMVGDLNQIARFMTVLFLTLYVAINVSAAMERLVAEPSYRPRVGIPWWVSLAGALAGIGVMFLISPVACGVAMALEGALFVWLRTRSLEQRWGDVAAGFWINIARYALLQVDRHEIHSRNWRPVLLLFVNHIEDRIELVKLAAAFGQNRGVLTVARLTFDKSMGLDERRELELGMRETLVGRGINAFCEVHAADDLHEGILEVGNSHGLANLRTNTVVFGWSETRAAQADQFRIMRDLAVHGKNILLVHFRMIPPEVCGRIDLWWGGQEKNGDLMLLLAYLLKLNPQWERASVRILSVVRTRAERERMQRGLAAVLPGGGIRAEVVVLETEDPFVEVLHRESGESDLVFLGMGGSPTTERAMEKAEWVDAVHAGLRATVLVQNNGPTRSVPDLLRL